MTVSGTGDKWAVITGASAGIGKECAKVLSARGYHLVVVARSLDGLNALKDELSANKKQVEVVALDLTLPEAPEQLVKITDAKNIIPEVLVNNAGIGCYGRFLDTKLPDQLRLLRLNVDTLISLSYLYGAKMRQRKNGYILQVASTAAFQPMPNYGLYAATKSLVLSFSRALNFESKADGVSSTALCPGATRTNFFDASKHTPSKDFERMMMPADAVARAGIDAMFARRDVHVSGLINSFYAFISRLVPASVMMRALAKATESQST